MGRKLADKQPQRLLNVAFSISAKFAAVASELHTPVLEPGAKGVAITRITCDAISVATTATFTGTAPKLLAGVTTERTGKCSLNFNLLQEMPFHVFIKLQSALLKMGGQYGRFKSFKQL